jgi:hypothetical protein
MKTLVIAGMAMLWAGSVYAQTAQSPYYGDTSTQQAVLPPVAGYAAAPPQGGCVLPDWWGGYDVAWTRTRRSDNTSRTIKLNEDCTMRETYLVWGAWAPYDGAWRGTWRSEDGKICITRVKKDAGYATDGRNRGEMNGSGTENCHSQSVFTHRQAAQR